MDSLSIEFLLEALSWSLGIGNFYSLDSPYRPLSTLLASSDLILEQCVRRFG